MSDTDVLRYWSTIYRKSKQDIELQFVTDA